MRRLLAGSLAFAAFTGTILVLPVYASPGPEPEPVEVTSEAVALGSVEDPASAADVQAGTTDPVAGVSDDAPALTVTRTGVDEFSLVNLNWAYDRAVTDTVVQVRVQDDTGRWGEWNELGVEDAEPNAGADLGTQRRGATAPLWTGPSTGVEVELVTRSGAAPTDVRVELIDPGASAADTAPGAPEIQDTADAAMAMPDVYSRAQWGADESLRTWAPEYAPTIKAATVHHTATSNNYTAAEVPAILRGIYYAHAVSNGWGDIGYNVVVDKFGRMWEGRSGGLASTVIGAHAGGFNTETFGVSMLGNYDIGNTTQPLVDSVSAIIAWKFSLYGVNPRGTTVLVSGGGGTARYARGTAVTLPTIFGHRDVGATACPGQYAYGRMGEIRDRVTAALAATQTISGRYSTEPALRALLGAPVGTQQTTAGVTWQAYANGRMYSSPTTGVRVVTGEILKTYLAAGGPADIGAPTTDELGTPDRVGRFNHFANNASIYWTPSTGARLVRGTIRTKWGTTGWETGPLGYPVTDELGAAGGVRYSTFQRGSIYWTQATGANAVSGAIGQLWNSLGGLGWGWGVPSTDELPTPDRVGRFNHFSRGASIYWSPSTGAHAVQGDIRTLWASMGWETGRLGYPTSDEVLAADGRTRYTTFQRGAIYWTPEGGAHALVDAIADRWTALGGLAWGWGVPTTDLLTTPDGAGRYTHFSRGASIYWSPSTGAHAVQGDIRTRWAAGGWERGLLGYPTSDELVTADRRGLYTTFQRGSVYWTPSGGTKVVLGVIDSTYRGLGAHASALGLPTSDEYPVPGGRRSDFEHGTITWTAATGATTVTPR